MTSERTTTGRRFKLTSQFLRKTYHESDLKIKELNDIVNQGNIILCLAQA